MQQEMSKRHHFLILFRNKMLIKKNFFSLTANINQQVLKKTITK